MADHCLSRTSIICRARTLGVRSSHFTLQTPYRPAWTSAAAAEIFSLALALSDRRPATPPSGPVQSADGLEHSEFDPHPSHPKFRSCRQGHFQALQREMLSLSHSSLIQAGMTLHPFDPALHRAQAPGPRSPALAPSTPACSRPEDTAACADLIKHRHTLTLPTASFPTRTRSRQCTVALSEATSKSASLGPTAAGLHAMTCYHRSHRCGRLPLKAHGVRHP